MSQTHSDSQYYLSLAVEYELESNEYTEKKQECWVKLGKEYEVEGIPRNEIGKRMQSAIEDRVEMKTGKKVKINTSHWYRVLNDNFWGIHQEQDEEIPLGEKPDSTQEELDKSDKTEEEVIITPEIENKVILDMLEKESTTIRKLINYTKLNRVASLIPPEVIDDICTRNNAMADNTRDYINQKQNIPTHAQTIILLQHRSSLGIHDLFSKFYYALKEIHMADLKQRMGAPLHKKEMRKFLLREIITLDHTMEPPDAATARLYGFYGQQCSHCQGHRTKIDPINHSKVYCIRCSPTKGKEERRSLKPCEKCGSDIDPGDSKHSQITKCASCQ